MEYYYKITLLQDEGQLIVDSEYISIQSTSSEGEDDDDDNHVIVVAVGVPIAVVIVLILLATCILACYYRWVSQQIKIIYNITKSFLLLLYASQCYSNDIYTCNTYVHLSQNNVKTYINMHLLAIYSLVMYNIDITI